VFNIESEVVEVPTEYVRINEVRMDWEDFFASTRILKSLTRSAHPAGALDERWLQEWEDRGVIERYIDLVSAADPERPVAQYPMIKAGRAYKEFRSALALFELSASAPAAAAARQQRDAVRHEDVVSLRGPRKRRKRGIVEWPEVVEF
jgi:hypothetical protein